MKGGKATLDSSGAGGDGCLEGRGGACGRERAEKVVPGKRTEGVQGKIYVSSPGKTAK